MFVNDYRLSVINLSVDGLTLHHIGPTSAHLRTNDQVMSWGRIPTSVPADVAHVALTSAQRRHIYWDSVFKFKYGVCYKLLD